MVEIWLEMVVKWQFVSLLFFVTPSTKFYNWNQKSHKINALCSKLQWTDQYCSTLGIIQTLDTLDTGHFFNTSLIQGLVFKGIVKGQESKVWAFFKGLRSFRGPQKQNWKNDQNSIIFGAKIKVRINFIWEKLMEFLLLNEVLKNWIFFQLPIQKSDFITLILSKFSILNANLWSIYSKRFEFMVYTCFCAFWKIKFFWLLRPSKSSGALKKVPAFGFLTFEYAFKN